MGAVTHIQWTDHTFNPWEGCTKVSPGCLHCYAESRNQRFTGGANWGKGAPRRRTSVHNWNEPKRWDRKAAEDYNEWAGHSALHGGNPRYPEPRRPRVFCASLADWLDDEVDLEWLADLLQLIHECTFLDWQLLTKRPQNWKPRLADVVNLVLTYRPADKKNYDLIQWVQGWLNGTPPGNVWIGWSCEDQQRLDERSPHGIEIPAKIHFVSCEPLLGPLNFFPLPPGGRQRLPVSWLDLGSCAESRIDWVIVGGESGSSARPMHIDWARDIRQQCAIAEVPFFFKQWGEWTPIYGTGILRGNEDDEADRYVWLSIEGKQCESGLAPDVLMIRPGKVAAGRAIDGKEHDEFPVLP